MQAAKLEPFASTSSVLTVCVDRDIFQYTLYYYLLKSNLYHLVEHFNV